MCLVTLIELLMPIHDWRLSSVISPPFSSASCWPVGGQTPTPTELAKMFRNCILSTFRRGCWAFSITLIVWTSQRTNSLRLAIEHLRMHASGQTWNSLLEFVTSSPTLAVNLSPASQNTPIYFVFPILICTYNRLIIIIFFIYGYRT